MTDETPSDTSDAAQPEPKGRRARTDVAVMMVLATLVSVLLIGAFNFFSARNLLNSTVEEQLLEVGDSRATRIKQGLDSVKDIAVTLADGPGVLEAVNDLADGYAVLDVTPTGAEVAELRSQYEEGIAAAIPPGFEAPTVDDLFPISERAQYLQSIYINQNPFEVRADLVDPGDDTQYSAAHAEHHPWLRAELGALELGDGLLIDAATSSVVYSVDKNIDFGTDLAAGPHRDSALASAVLDRLRSAAVDEAVLVDIEPYAPAGNEPVLFVAAAIRDQGRVVGALALEVPDRVLTEITTADQDWEDTGLGDTGEIYIVGGDRRLRTESRLWLEDPAGYLDALDDAGYDAEVGEAVEAFGTTVLIQPADTDPVEAALAGDFFVGGSANYLDQGTLSVAAELDIPEVNWAMVAEVTTAEAQGPLRRHMRNLVILAVVLIPIVIALAFFIARGILRPIDPIMAAAGRVGEGDIDVELVVPGRDEYADLAKKFDGVLDALQEQRADLQATAAETTELLLAVLPRRLVEQYQRGDRELAEAVRNATMIAVFVEEPEVVAASEQEILAEHTAAISTGLVALAEQFGVEHLGSTATQALYAVGLQVEGEEAGPAVAFAAAAQAWIAEAAEAAGLVITSHFGLAAGDVFVGVVGTERIAFNVWGAPRRDAATLAAVAAAGQILVDPAVASQISDEWAVEPVPELVDLAGKRLKGWWVVGRRADVEAAEETVETP
jgi:class 3 adenylate cyclase/nitrate reductase NapE component